MLRDLINNCYLEVSVFYNNNLHSIVNFWHTNSVFYQFIARNYYNLWIPLLLGLLINFFKNLWSWRVYLIPFQLLSYAITIIQGVENSRLLPFTMTSIFLVWEKRPQAGKILLFFICKEKLMKRWNFYLLRLQMQLFSKCKILYYLG